MTDMHNPRGSSWRKWDLHVHTPASLVQQYGGDAGWDAYIEALEALPHEIKVIGINDYIFVDGYERVVAEKRSGRLSNLDLILPVIELRLGRFGGTVGALSRVNYHVIFSDEIDVEIIKSQFLAPLCSNYTLSPQYSAIADSGQWAATPTRQSLIDLGEKIIASVPAAERHKFNAPLTEGFNNISVELRHVEEILKRPQFHGRVLTAVGKTEWYDIKWNEQSIADKKTIINGVDLVFTAASTVGDCLRSRSQLEAAGVNWRILDCSDAHRFADSGDKDRLGNCFTWIKSDPTFEGLKQAVFQYADRVAIASDHPIEPPLQIRKVTMNFPQPVTLSMDGSDEAFCFQGRREVTFSPYLTCIIGGRGTGKSTLLNLMHERLSPGSSPFFRTNKIGPKPHNQIPDCIGLEGSIDHSGAEFLQQDEIEGFATDPSRFTSAIFSRLVKLDAAGVIEGQEAVLSEARRGIQTQLERVGEYYALESEIIRAKQDRASSEQVVESFQNDDYKRISSEIGTVSKELQALKGWKARLDDFSKDVESVLRKHPSLTTATSNPYEVRFRKLRDDVAAALADASQEDEAASGRVSVLEESLKGLRQELDAFLTARGLSPENLADVGQASERIATLNEQIPAGELRLARLKSEMEAFEFQRPLAEAYAHKVNELLGPINERLGALSAEVKSIELVYEFDGAAHEEAVHDWIVELLSAESRHRKDHVSHCLREVDFQMIGDSTSLVSLISDGSKAGKALRECFASEENFQCLRLEIERTFLDVRSFGRVKVLYDGRPVEKSSFGQRCTAAIVVLLLLGNTPIIIDEPEAHLDSGLIAKYLVDLVKQVKTNRQIIFATHNANFVVNGDAELIHILGTSEEGFSEVKSTTIEDLEHRSDLLGLEGGREAFQMRERRYGVR
ncbi:MAG: TrlF family AAA-like ATPase [Fimbriimonas sp.]